MRPSRFVLTYNDVCPGEHVVYDVIGNKYVGLDDPTLASLTRWENSPPVGVEESTARTLTEMGFLVRDEAEDEGRLEAHLEAAAQGMPGTLYVTLLPTLACNLACTYCFQREHPTKTLMSDETEGQAVGWVLSRYDEARTSRLLVHYAGGEPLTRKDFLLRNAATLSGAMRARGGEFEWELTTNGVGLHPAFVNALCSFGRGSVKVTLDGDQETHDAARVRRDGGGTFQEVFDNLVAVTHECRDVKVKLGGNFLPGQDASYVRLLDRLVEAGLKGLLEMVRFKPALEVGNHCDGCGPDTGEIDTMVALERMVAERGLGKVRPQLIDVGGIRELHWRNSWVIDPTGQIYKCAAVAGRQELALGDVKAGQVRADPLTLDKPWKKCGNCPFVPVCAGGCIGGSYLGAGDRKTECRLEEFEKSFREAVIARYLAEFHPDEARVAA